MKQRIRIQYGVATVVRLGTVRSPTTGQAVTPTFAAGDVLITQDDGTGTDNIDTLSTLDGTDVLLTISAAEASPASGQYGRRVIKMYDQTVPAIWLDADIIMETENHHLATYPNGVLRGFTPQAISATTVTFDAAASTEIVPTGLVVVITASNDPLDVGHSATIASWVSGTQVATLASAGWSRTPTGSAANIRCSAYTNPPGATGSVDEEQVEDAVGDALDTYGVARPHSKQGQGAADFT